MLHNVALGARTMNPIFNTEKAIFSGVSVLRTWLDRMSVEKKVSVFLLFFHTEFTVKAGYEIYIDGYHFPTNLHALYRGIIVYF